MKRTILLVLAVVIAAPFFLGCGALINVAGNGDRTPYGGTRFDAATCVGGLASGVGIGPPDQKLDRPASLGLGCCALADLPFSLVADTLTLPLTLPTWFEETAKEKAPEASRSVQQ